MPSAAANTPRDQVRMVVLDTDLLSLLERDSGDAATLRRRLRGAEAGAVVTTIINFEERGKTSR